MTREDLMRAFLDAWNAHDADAATSIMTEDCVFEPSIGPEPWGDRLTGRAAVRAWALKTFAAIPNIRWVPIRSVADDSFAVFEFHVTGDPKIGPQVNIYACDILTLRDNEISAKRAYRKTSS